MKFLIKMNTIIYVGLCDLPIPCKENRERCICSITKNVPTFKNLSREDLHQITEISSLKNFRKDEIIFFEDQACKNLYLLLNGKVKIYKTNDSRELILRIIENNMIFAEAPVFDEVPFYNASAAALEDSEVLMFDKEKFQEIAFNKPELVKNLLSLFSSRIRNLDKQIEYLNLKGVESRLANYLLELKPINSDGECLLELPVSKTMLASMLGTVIETLSRSLKNFKTKGLISVDENQIRILDYEKLEELAQN